MILVTELNGRLMVNNILSLLLVFFIRFYQLFFSPLLGVNCRFYPTCSNYSIEALKKYGLFKGIFLSSKRLLSCHPFGQFGFQPLIVENTPSIKIISAEKIQLEREKSLYKNFPKYFSKYDEDEDKSTVHLGLYLNDNLVSGLTLIKKKLNKSDPLSFQIRGMFTKQKFLNKGYGSILIKYAKNELIKSKNFVFWCNSRKKSNKFL